MERSELTREAVENIIRAQATRTQRLAAADWIVFNEGLNLDQLQQEVNALALTV